MTTVAGMSAPQQQQQQQQMAPGKYYSCNFGDRSGRTTDKITKNNFVRRFRHPASTEKPTDELVAVVLTSAASTSYDDLFKALPQQPGEGKRVAVYQMHNESVGFLCATLTSQASGATGDVAQMFADVASIDADSFVVNFECCGGCSDRGFSDNARTQEAVKMLLDRGHMVMCSDFSLKALIGSWNDSLLGPNPFKTLGDFGGHFELSFDPVMLAQCPSAQLQQVGELCCSGKAHVEAMSSTICYTVLPSVYTSTTAYRLEVLTVATHIEGFDLAQHHADFCGIGDAAGAAGHVLLTYPSGGRLLTSAGHWIELQRLDVSLEGLLVAAASRYGAAEGDRMRSEMADLSLTEQSERVQCYSRQYVQSSTPCRYSSKRG